MALQIESLEERLVPTTVGLTKTGDLLIESPGSLNDMLQIQADVAKRMLLVTNQTDRFVAQISFDSFLNAKQLIVNTFDGDDVVQLSVTGGSFGLSTVIDAGNGNDLVAISAVNSGLGALTVVGGAGNDTISVGSDLLLGSTTLSGNLSLTAKTIQMGAANIATNGGIVVLDGAVALKNSLAIITTSNGNSGNVQLPGTVSGSVANCDVTIDATTKLGNIGGAVSLAKFDKSAGNLVRNLKVTAANTGTGSGGDVTLADAVTLDGFANISGRAISFSNATSSLAVSSTATVDLNAIQSIALASGSSISAVDGDITLATNTAGTASGNSIGIDVAGGATVGNATGHVSLIGRGSGNHGVVVGGTVSGGSVDVTGFGGSGSGSVHGVLVEGTITSTNGSSGVVNVTGTGGGNNTSDHCYGVYVHGTIESGGGDVIVTGLEGLNSSGLAINVIAAGSITTAANGGNTTVLGNSMNFDSSSSISVSNGNQVTIATQVAGLPINLGAATDPIGGPLSLSDAELDRVTAGMIVIGGPDAGPITVSDAITRAKATNLALATDGNHSITFSGPTASLDASGGNVDLIVLADGTVSGSGGIFSGGAKVAINAAGLKLTAGSAGIGTASNPLTFNASTLSTNTNSSSVGSQFLSELDGVTIVGPALNAGTATITLTHGSFLTSQLKPIMSRIIVASGATLGGIGMTSDVTAESGAIIAPGNSPGVLNTGSVTFAAGSTFRVELNGAGVGTQYDQLNVTGSVVINSNAILDRSLGFTPTPGTTFVIINNDGSDAVNGTFNGLPQGSVFTINGQRFRIVYDDVAGGDNIANDVALIALGVSPVANAGGSYVVDVGSGVTLDASKSTDADSNVLTYRWDVNGDGSYSENITGVSPQLTAADLAALGLGTGAKVVKVTVEVSDGLNTSTASTFLSVLPAISNLSGDTPGLIAIVKDAIAAAGGDYRDPAIIELMTAIVTKAVAAAGGNLRDPRILNLIAGLSRAVSDTLPTSSPSIVIVADPVDLLLTDPQDRNTGFIDGDSRNGNNIPGAYYSGSGSVELLVVPQASIGNYTLTLSGVGSAYNVAFTVANDGDGEVHTTAISGADSTVVEFQVAGPRPIPFGLGLASNSGSAPAIGVVGTFGQFGLRLALASDEELGELNTLDLDSSNARSFELMSWLISTVRVARRQILEPLWQTLESPLGDLLGDGLPMPTGIPPKLVDQFWGQVGQSLTGVPSGIYRLGNMLESLLPTFVPSRNHSTTPRNGEQGQPKTAPGNSGVKPKRPTQERPRSTPTPPPTGGGSSRISPPANSPNTTIEKSTQAETLPAGNEQSNTARTRWLWFTFKDESPSVKPAARRNA